MKNKYFSLLSTLLLLSACTTKIEPLTNTNEVTHKGYSFSPPQDGEWYSMKSPANKSGFTYAMKVPDLKVRSPKHSVILSAQFGNFNAYDSADLTLEWVKKNKEAQLSNRKRFSLKNSKYSLQWYKKTRCLNYSTEVEDHKTPAKEKQIMTHKGMFCLHPDDNNSFIDISYSQRYSLSREPLKIKRQGLRFVRSLKFLNLEKKN